MLLGGSRISLNCVLLWWLVQIITILISSRFQQNQTKQIWSHTIHYNKPFASYTLICWFCAIPFTKKICFMKHNQINVMSHPCSWELNPANINSLFMQTWKTVTYKLLIERAGCRTFMMHAGHDLNTPSWDNIYILYLLVFEWYVLIDYV